MKHLINLLTALGISLASFAQTTGSASGSVKDGITQKGIEGATISLLRAGDSSLVKSDATSPEGKFLLNDIKEGSYLLSSSSTGYGNVYTPVFVISSTQLSFDAGTLLLQPVNKDLKAVVVSSKKPFIEQRLDRTIINVDAAVTNTGSTALEVLEKSPGVTVDKDGNISLKGKQGVMVMLDGKPSYLNAQELSNLLKNMPSSSIDQIELMANPSAKYDAAGNSGVINIKTKKNKQKGFNGSLNLAYGQGIYNRTNNSLNLNYRTGKFNLFTNLSGNYRRSFKEMDINRKYKNADGSINAIFDQTNNEQQRNYNYNAKVGADYYATKNTTIGVVLTGFTSPSNQHATNTSYLKNGQNLLDSIVTSSSYEDAVWKQGAVNLNFRHQFDSSGAELTGDVDYLNYSSNRDQRFINTGYTPAMQQKGRDELIGELPTDINIYTAKVDYSKPFKSGIKLETGLKTSFVETDNTAGYFNMIGGNKMTDYDKTNRFRYKENINAVYLNMNREIKKWGIQAGLRLENTRYEGNQFGNPQRTDSSFKKNYTGLFPTLFVSYKANPKNQFGLSYGRRINRPDYDDLNPFLFFIDKYTYGAGNPFLRPSYAHTLEITHTYKDFLTTTINYSNTKDLFSDVFEQKEYATVVRKDNFGQANNISVSNSAQLNLLKWLSSNVYMEFNYNDYKGFFNGENVKTKGTNFLINVNNQFKFKNGWSAELSGFYRTRGIDGQIVISSLGQVSAGIQKQILKNKASLKLNIRDIFYTQNVTGNINFQQTEAFFRQTRDTRIATIGFSYRFGKPIKNVVKRKTGGAASEQNRVKGAE